MSWALAASDGLPAWATVALAAITGAAGVIGGVLGARKQASATLGAAQTAAKGAIQQAAQDRFATWQNRKRDLYAEFLGAARTALADPANSAAENNYLTAYDRAMLVAFDETRAALEDLADGAAPLSSRERWRQTTATLDADVRKVGAA